MIWYRDIQQGSAAWLELRCGIPTASNFYRIMTPSGKPSTQATDYLHSLLAERMMGHPIEEHVSLWMQRGKDLEAEAVRFFEFQRETTTEPLGFVTNDAGTVGASPDRLVGDDGLLEIKVPKDSTHVGYLLDAGVDQAYMPQVQGQLWIAERQWLDLMSYHPEMPPALIRVDRDDAYIAKLSAAVETFAEVLAQHAEVLRARGWLPELASTSGGGA
jgi:hypothetical protein